ncbi:metallophosphoesterase [Candidatus Woesearchaeota archaeon]|nr:metallophosphoesterase [Candidatus Woesearchaeota archaeon]
MKGAVNIFLENDFLPSPDIIKDIKNIPSKEIIEAIQKNIEFPEKLLVINKDIIAIIPKLSEKADINWAEFEKAKVMIEKGKIDKTYNIFLDLLTYKVEDKKKKELDKLLEEVKKEEKLDINEEPPTEAPLNVIILKTYKDDPKKLEVADFVEYFKIRYNLIKEVLQNRQEIQDPISINRILTKKEKETVAFIGIVYNKKTTKNNNILLTIEDPTGLIDVLVNKEGKAIENARNIVNDEVIGIAGVYGGRVVFATNIIFPDIPLSKELKKCDEEVYAAFISDLHFGSKLFLKDDFIKFIEWINGKTGSFLQKRVSSKVKYLFIIGDSVDGVGVYPNQDKELVLKDISQQYELCAEYLGMIRKDIKIILAPGQHDSIRVAEPQPQLDKEFAKSLYALPNVIFVSNPSLVNIHSKKDFEGFNVLIYHGASYHHYIDEIDSLRQTNTRDNPTNILKFLLQKRHLAPSHTSTVYIPSRDHDPFFIDKIPDLMLSGEMHRSDVATYNNITMINCSCFQGKTPFQEKTGNNPLPSRVPIMNLKTREVKILNFSSEEE